jgi:EAL domain-containing protein (putative c-di-GMP-specific phosphodiesterase class I)
VLCPPAFLPQIIDAERAREVTAVVVTDALAACARWASAGVSLPVAVNVSAADFEDDELARRLTTLLQRERVAPGQVTLEVTGTVLQADPERARRSLTELRCLGLRVSLDDYGSGSSSPSHLRDFPLDELKLDPTLLGDVPTEPVTSALLRSTIDLAHTLGLTVVAEGVERPADLFALRQLGCDHGQGYLWSPALAPLDVLAWVADRRLQRAVPTSSDGHR